MIPISQLRKLRLRELVYLTLNHKTNKKQSQNETQVLYQSLVFVFQFCTFLLIFLHFLVTSFSPVTYLLIPLILSICPVISISKSLPDSLSPSLLSYSCSFSWLLANLINWIPSQGKDIIFYSSSIKSTFYIKFQFPWEARCGGYFVVSQNQSASVNPQKVNESMFLVIAAGRSFLVNNGVS